MNDTDQNGNNKVELDELLRLIQFFNSGGFFHCPGRATEDGFCPGEPDATVTVTPDSASIGLGGGLYLAASSTDGTEPIRWETSDVGVATVDSAGGVAAAGAGTVRIRATGEMSGAWAEAEVTVLGASLTVEPPTVFVRTGESVQVMPASSVDPDAYDYDAADGQIASVTPGGLISGQMEGETAVLVTSQGTGLTVPVPVTVLGPEATVPVPGRSAVSVEELEGGAWGDTPLKITLDDDSEFMLQELEDTALYNTAAPDLSGEPEGETRSSHITVPTTRPAARYVSLGAWQTPIRNQRDRNTCVVFALLAGLEAAYNRAGHGELDLSEQYMNHIGKMTWLHPFPDGEPRPRGVWENQLGMTAGGGVLGVAQLTRYGVPTEAQVPYRHSNQAGHVWEDYHNVRQPGDYPGITADSRSGVTQREMDEFNLEHQSTTWSIPRNYTFTPLPVLAQRDAQYGVTRYEICPPERINDLAWFENVLDMGYEVLFQANLAYDVISDGTWVAKNVPPDTPVGSHAMCMVGYDRRNPWYPYFIVKNSWGEEGFIRLHYNFVSGRLHGRVTHAVFITGIASPAQKPYKTQAALGRWHIETDLYSDPAELGIFRQSVWFDRDFLGGLSDRRLGEFYDAAGNPYKVNGFIFPNFVEWRLDPANPNADFQTLGGNRFFGYFDIESPELMAGYYVTPGGAERGFYGHKYGTLPSRSVLETADGDAVFLGRWNIVHHDVPGYVEVTRVGNPGNGITATYEAPGGERWGFGGTATTTTLQVTIPLNNIYVDRPGTFQGHILETNSGIMAGYFAPQSGVRNGMVLQRVNYAEIEVEITAPASGASVLAGQSITLQAGTFGDGMPVTSPGPVVWTLDAPSGEGGTFIASGANTTWSTPTPGTYNVFATYTEGSVTGPDKRAVDQVTITVNAATAPNVTITSPPDGSTYTQIADPAIVEVTFQGTASDNEDGPIPGSALHWSYRAAGTGTWTDAGTGSSKTIALQDTICFEYTYYEVRLQATDSDELTGTDIITVGVDALFCR